MKLQKHTDPKEFLAKILPFLLNNETENCLFLGILHTLVNQPDRFPIAFLGLVLGEEDKIMGGCWMTPPFPLGLSRMPPEAINLVLMEAEKFESKPNAMMGPKETVSLACERWQQSTGARIKSHMRQGVHRLERVLTPKCSEGKIRVVSEEERVLLIDWNLRFMVDCKLSIEEQSRAELEAARAIQSKNRYIWEVNGSIVSMAGYSGETPSGIRINWVYTPPSLRGRGYATSLVASLSQKLLNEGKKFCFLFTDLSNPTSNSIYRKIGYEKSCEFEHYTFEA